MHYHRTEEKGNQKTALRNTNSLGGREGKSSFDEKKKSSLGSPGERRGSLSGRRRNTGEKRKKETAFPVLKERRGERRKEKSTLPSS